MIYTLSIVRQAHALGAAEREGTARAAKVFFGTVDYFAGDERGSDGHTGVFYLDVASATDVARVMSILRHVSRPNNFTIDERLPLPEENARGLASLLAHLDTQVIVGNLEDLDDQFRSALVEPDGSWYAITIEGSSADATATVSLYPDTQATDSTLGTIASMQRIEGTLASALAYISRLGYVADSTEEKLASILDKVGPTSQSLVAVYDVGQGNANAICDDRACPILYFDFGWPLGFHASSAPIVRPPFCFTNKPPIVLSHWDVDHWNSVRMPTGGWHTAALAAPWIAPRQFMGPNHIRLASALIASSNLHLWPAGLHRLDFANGRIVLCTGNNSFSRRDRNDSGLAMYCTASNTRGDTTKAVLLPGDADYPYVPDQANFAIVGLVGTHHGGAILGAPPAMHDAKLALSYGIPNKYGHPAASALAQYAKAGWSAPIETGNRTAFCASIPFAAPGNVAVATDTLRLPLCHRCAIGHQGGCLIQ